jgi:hypothetical protein
MLLGGVTPSHHSNAQIARWARPLKATVVPSSSRTGSTWKEWDRLWHAPDRVVRGRILRATAAWPKLRA